MEQDKNEGIWLRLTEETNALDYLEKAYDFIQKVETDISAWKWVIIALHGALYGFAICASRGTSPDIVAPVIQSGKKKGERQLISFNRALELCQNPKLMRMTVNSKHLQLSSSQEESIWYLHEVFRNNFEHFTPKAWSIELHGLPQIAIDILEVIRFLALETGNYVHLNEEQIERVEYVVAQGKRILEQSQLHKELEELKES